MEDEPVCNQYITLSLTVLGYILFAASEVLGLRKNKTSKCTSIVQAGSAVLLWLYWKINCRQGTLRRSKINMLHDQGALDAGDAGDAESTVSAHINIEWPSWRNPPPGITRSARSMPPEDNT